MLLSKGAGDDVFEAPSLFNSETKVEAIPEGTHFPNGGDYIAPDYDDSNNNCEEVRVEGDDDAMPPPPPPPPIWDDEEPNVLNGLVKIQKQI